MAIANLTLFSNILNMDMDVALILPENKHGIEELHRDKLYPVVYCLHGYRDNYMSWLRQSTIMLEAKKKECIIVMPDCKNSFYTNGKNGFNYYDYLTKELPTKLANYFPISLKREETFIMGASMGGYGAFLAAMSKPEQYAKAFCFSGPLCVEYENGKIFGFDERMNKQIGGAYGSQKEYYDSIYYLPNLAKQLDEYQGNKPALMAICGLQDPALVYSNKFIEYVKNTTSLKIEYITSDGEHDYFYWNKYIKQAFEFFGI